MTDVSVIGSGGIGSTVAHILATQVNDTFVLIVGDEEYAVTSADTMSLSVKNLPLWLFEPAVAVEPEDEDDRPDWLLMQRVYVGFKAQGNIHQKSKFNRIFHPSHDRRVNKRKSYINERARRNKI